MLFIRADSIVPAAQNWLMYSRQPRVLHIFDRACNLINERREVLSIVTRQIGNGPFNLILEDNVCFCKQLSADSPISISPGHLTLGELIITTTNAHFWNPRPDWETLHANRSTISRFVTTNQRESTLSMSLTKYARDYSTIISLQSLLSSLFHALANNDISTTRRVTSKLAGLGVGLTPAGDDLLLGAMYAAWIIHPRDVASDLAEVIARTAAPLTTSLSAAWLQAGARGEAGVLWHALLNALLIDDSSAIQLQVGKLLSVGQTSGADALTGFIGTLTRGTERLPVI